MTNGMRKILERSERAGRLSQAHRTVHEAARLIAPGATTAEIAACVEMLEAAAAEVARVRREILADEMKEFAS